MPLSHRRRPRLLRHDLAAHAAAAAARRGRSRRPIPACGPPRAGRTRSRCARGSTRPRSLSPSAAASRPPSGPGWPATAAPGRSGGGWRAFRWQAATAALRRPRGSRTRRPAARAGRAAGRPRRAAVVMRRRSSGGGGGSVSTSRLTREAVMTAPPRHLKAGDRRAARGRAAQRLSSSTAAVRSTPGKTTSTRSPNAASTMPSRSGRQAVLLPADRAGGQTPAVGEHDRSRRRLVPHRLRSWRRSAARGRSARPAPCRPPASAAIRAARLTRGTVPHAAFVGSRASACRVRMSPLASTTNGVRSDTSACRSRISRTGFSTISRSDCRSR